LGREIALELAREGAELLLLDRDGDALWGLEGEIAAEGGQSTSVPADLTDAVALESAIRKFEAKHRKLDLLVVAAEEFDESSFVDGSPDRWQSLVSVNILGALFAVRAVLPSFLERRTGHIVLLSATAGRESCPGRALYGATKWAITGLGHALRSEAECFGIAVTVVEPGSTIWSGLSKCSSDDAQLPGEMGRAVAKTVTFALAQSRYASISEVVVRVPDTTSEKKQQS
jgi:NADP-dependent 3-hydroxy acid dehydrogenase YdfG